MEKTYYQVVTYDRDYNVVLQSYTTDEAEAKKEVEQFKSFWPDQDWWIEEGTEYIKTKCRGCGTPEANEIFDAHGITTGHWCPKCYNSKKYPYKKYRYATIQTHGYGENLE